MHWLEAGHSRRYGISGIVIWVKLYLYVSLNSSWCCRTNVWTTFGTWCKWHYLWILIIAFFNSIGYLSLFLFWQHSWVSARIQFWQHLCLWVMIHFWQHMFVCYTNLGKRNVGQWLTSPTFGNTHAIIFHVVVMCMCIMHLCWDSKAKMQSRKSNFSRC